MGERCPVAAKSGHCFVDEHHLYFPRAKFTGDALTDAFQSDPFNRIRLPRCQHNSGSPSAVHSQHHGTPKPKREIMGRFLEEASLLRELGIVSIKSDGLLAATFEEDASSSTLQRRRESWEEAQNKLRELLARAQTECEVITPFLLRRGEQISPRMGGIILPTLMQRAA
jgi:hypothetical protein